MPRSIKKHEVVCADCCTTFERTAAGIKKSIAKHGRFVCFKCFWQLPEQREKQRLGMQTSEAHKESRKIVSAKLTGENNPMFGKSLPDEVRAKMSVARRKRIGEKAPNWKGGEQSLVYQVKKMVNQRHQWAKRIYERDNWVCTTCGSKTKLDAHHITPFATLLREAHAQTDLQGDSLIHWLTDHPALKDAQGTTLYRKCHREIHENWGSHQPKIQNASI